MTVRILASFFALTLTASLFVRTVNAESAPPADGAYACGAETYRTRGVVKGITDDKKLVNIAHESIEGYMMAMTMTFEPRSPAQIATLKAGDRIRFTFTVTDDGRRLLDQVTVD